jgi:hypothetical protein
MDGIETPVASPAPVASAPAAPAPVAEVAPAAPVAPVTAPVTAPQGQSVTEILKGLNWVEIGFGVLGSAALFYMIYYYRYNINTNKTLVSDMQNKIDELTIKVSDLSSVINEKEKTQQSGADGTTFI